MYYTILHRSGWQSDNTWKLGKTFTIREDADNAAEAMRSSNPRDNTYNVRDHIKTNWDGKWDANRKVWIVNPAKVIDTISNKTWGIDRILSIETDDDASQVKPVSPMGNWYFVNKHGQRELSDDF